MEVSARKKLFRANEGLANTQRGAREGDAGKKRTCLERTLAIKVHLKAIFGGVTGKRENAPVPSARTTLPMIYGHLQEGRELLPAL